MRLHRPLRGPFLNADSELPNRAAGFGNKNARMPSHWQARPSCPWHPQPEAHAQCSGRASGLFARPKSEQLKQRPRAQSWLARGPAKRTVHSTSSPHAPVFQKRQNQVGRIPSQAGCECRGQCQCACCRGLQSPDKDHASSLSGSTSSRDRSFRALDLDRLRFAPARDPKCCFTCLLCQ